MTIEKKSIPSVSVSYARNGSSTKANALGMRPMQERAYEKRGEQYLLIIKSPPASGKSRALMFIAVDKLHNQGLRQAIIVVPEKSIGASFNDEPLTRFGFWADWTVAPKWNLCNAPGSDNGGKVNSVAAFLESDDKVLVCTHATFRFAVDKFGIEAFDDRLIAVDEFHHVSASPDNKLGLHLGQFIARDRVHILAMTGSYFRGDAEAVLAPQDEAKFDTVTYTYYEQLNGYEYLKQLDIGYFFYSRTFPETYADDILNVRPKRRSSTSPASIRAKVRRTRSGRSSTSSRNWASGRGPNAPPASSWSRRARAGSFGSPTSLMTIPPSATGFPPR
jgi:superfamily II DNA or RNA helicase